MIITEDRLISLIYLSAIGGLCLTEVVLILSVINGKFIMFGGGVFLLILLLIILRNLNLGLCLLPIVLGTSVSLIPSGRVHLAEFVIVVISMSLLAHLALENKTREWVFPQKGPIILFLFASVISLSNAHYLNTGITHIIKLVIAFVLIFSLIYNRIKNDKLLAKATVSLILMGLVASIYGLGQYFLNSSPTTGFLDTRIFGRAGGLYGGIVGFSIVLLCSYLMFARKGIKKIYVFLFLIPVSITLILSQIRAWYAGVIIALIFIVLFRISKGKKMKSLAIWAIIGILCLLFFTPIMDLSFITFKFLFMRGLDLPSYGNLMGIGISMDYSLLSRINIWKYAWNLFLENPLTGIGVANFRISDPFHPNLSKPVYGHAFADNHYINILVETGILGAIAWIWLLVNIFRSSRKLLRHSVNSELEWISVGLIGSFLMFLVGGIFWCLTPLLNEACLTAFLFSLILAAERIVIKRNLLFQRLVDTKSNFD